MTTFKPGDRVEFRATQIDTSYGPYGDGDPQGDLNGSLGTIVRDAGRPSVVYVNWDADTPARNAFENRYGAGGRDADEATCFAANLVPAPAEPDYKPGDWVKVADDAPYNEFFRGQTLQVLDANWAGSEDSLLLCGTNGWRGAVRKSRVTPAEAPGKYTDEIAALRAKAAEARAEVVKIDTETDALIKRRADAVDRLTTYTQAAQALETLGNLS